MSKEPLEPSKAVGDCFKLLLRSTNATAMPDNSFRFNVDMSVIEGDDVRCAVRKITYPPPATYIARRLWFASGNSWKTSYTNGQGKVNDYDTLLAKYGLNAWIYIYYTPLNLFFRLLYNNTENTQIRQTSVSSSADGVNWSASTTSYSTIGFRNNIEYSGGASAPFDCYEIDTTTTPVGTNIQNIHIQELSARRSWDTNKMDLTDIIGNIPRTIPANPYVYNDATFEVKDYDCCNEISADQLKSIRTLNVSFSRVDTAKVKENVVLPWSMEVMFFID